MSTHPFNFNGGSELSSMGATWFVSYAYYTHIDKSHKTWEKLKTHPYRASVFRRTTHYHKYWLERILEMDEKRLNTNMLQIDASRVKEMARQLLASGAA